MLLTGSNIGLEINSSWLELDLEKAMAPHSSTLPGKSHGRRSLVGCSPWGRQESDTTKRLPFHFSLSCIGEGNGNPLQCSCLENPRDGGAWWAAVYGVAKSRTRLKWLSSSSSSRARLIKIMCLCASQVSSLLYAVLLSFFFLSSKIYLKTWFSETWRQGYAQWMRTCLPEQISKSAMCFLPFFFFF